MQLDKTFIAVRERDYLDILDLSLHVLRNYFVPLTIALVCGIAPFALACHALAWGTGTELNETDWRMEYTMKLGYLAAFAAPLAGAPATLLLGQTLFSGKPNARRLLSDFVGSLPQLILFQVLFRGVLYVFCIPSFFPSAFWPYLTEVVLLERNPLSAGRQHRITTLRRSGALHRGMFGDLLGRWVITFPLAVLLAALLALSLWGTRQWVYGTREIDRTSFQVFLNIGVWSAVSYLTVVRFLSYLDVRIRREGWEVELKMRAEAAQLEHELL